MGLFNRKKTKSKDIVTERLVSVLVEDRTGVSPNTLLMIKKETSAKNAVFPIYLIFTERLKG